MKNKTSTLHFTDFYFFIGQIFSKKLFLKNLTVSSVFFRLSQNIILRIINLRSSVGILSILFIKDWIFQIFFSRCLDMTWSILILLWSQELLKKNYSIWISNEIFQRLLLKIGNSYSFEKNRSQYFRSIFETGYSIGISLQVGAFKKDMQQNSSIELTFISR